MKNLYITMAHMDDFECSCLAYLDKHQREYDNIHLIIFSSWKGKEEIFKKNIEEINDYLTTPVFFKTLNYDQRKLYSLLDDVKDEFYSLIDFDVEFDILTHDKNDTHTDHLAVHIITNGLYKFARKYISVYSPSSSNFNPNYFLSLCDDAYAIKKNTLDRYIIEAEQSYSKTGYYLQSEEHYNIGKSYVLENVVDAKDNYYEIYKIYKWM